MGGKECFLRIMAYPHCGMTSQQQVLEVANLAMMKPVRTQRAKSTWCSEMVLVALKVCP